MSDQTPKPTNWPFDQPPEAAAITTQQVISGKEPVRVVTHFLKDASWAFSCGTTDSPAHGRLVRMRDAVGRDSTLFSIADLPPGWTAWRNKMGGEWERVKTE